MLPDPSFKPRKLDWTAMATDDWSAAVSDFLQVAASAMDGRKETVRIVMKVRGDEHEHEFESESDSRFDYWFSRVSTYAAVILIHSLVESQLFAYADRLQERHNLRLRWRDLQGRGITQAKTYLLKVANLDSLAQDPGWATLKDLEEIRNIIVHRRGHKGADPKKRAAAEAVAAKHSILHVWIEPSLRPEDETIRISFEFCEATLKSVQ